ncbi:MAG: RNA methyltransferase [Crocinitomicaceae bacterium]|nr:RNA methyltransferase [Crocinitomicaceae bacterium]
MALEITSIKNPRIKFLQSLEKSRDRKESQSFMIEGIREISLAQQSGYEFTAIYVCEAVYVPDAQYPIELTADDILHVTEDVFAHIAYRENSGGIIAVAKMKALLLDDIKPKSNGLYLILERVEKPGNMGAMLRTADAAGLDGVIICDQSTDFFNPNVVRSSVGCLFTVPVAAASNDEVLAWCHQGGIKLFAAALTAKKSCYEADFKNSTAILMGSESEGLSTFWLKQADEQILIPMKGKIDSMNVSNAAAILLFEAIRQRSVK